MSSPPIRVPSLSRLIRVNPCPSVVQNDQNHGCHGSTRIAKRENTVSPACLLCPHSRTFALKANPRAHGPPRIARNGIDPHPRRTPSSLDLRPFACHSRPFAFHPFPIHPSESVSIRGPKRLKPRMARINTDKTESPSLSHPHSLPDPSVKIRVHPWSKKVETTDQTDTTQNPPFPVPPTVTIRGNSRPFALKSEPRAHGTHGISRIGFGPTLARAPPDPEIPTSRMLLPRSRDPPGDATSTPSPSTLVRRNRRFFPLDAPPETSRSCVTRPMEPC